MYSEIHQLQQEKIDYDHKTWMWQFKTKEQKFAHDLTVEERNRWVAFVQQHMSSIEAKPEPATSKSWSTPKRATSAAQEKKRLGLSNGMVCIFCSLVVLVCLLFLYPGLQAENLKLQVLLQEQRQDAWEQLCQQDERLNKLHFRQQQETQRHVNSLEHIQEGLHAPKPNVQRLKNKVAGQLKEMYKLPGSSSDI